MERAAQLTKTGVLVSDAGVGGVRWRMHMLGIDGFGTLGLVELW
jgi:hypothetical protein